MNRETQKNPKNSTDEMKRVVSGAEGKELMALLAQSGSLKAAMEAFKKGDMKGVQAALEPVMETERAKELVRKINNGK